MDDEPAGRTVLSYFIQEYGSDLFGPIVTCSSIKETLETLESFDPDLMFVDIELQGESGLELRNLAPSIPTVVVSEVLKR